MRLLFRRSVPNIIIIIILILISTVVLSKNHIHPVIGLHQNTPNVIAIKNAHIVTAPGKILQNATMIIRDGFIEDIGLQVVIPADAVIIDLSNKIIYPGLIDIFTNYGLSKKNDKEKKSDPGNRSGSVSKDCGSKHWNDAVHPQLQAARLLNISEKEAESFRNIGFTTVVTYPSEGIFRGSGALVLLNDKDPNKVILATDVAQALSFKKDKGIKGYPGSLKGSIALIRQTFLDAQWYNLAWSKFTPGSNIPVIQETNLALAALEPYITGNKPVVFAVSDELDVLRVAKITKEFNLNTWVLSDGYEYRRLQAIKNTGLKLIVSLNFPEPPDLSSPEKEFDSAKLANVGVDFVLTTASLKKKDKFLSNLRKAVKRGLPTAEALKALTVTPAKWLKVSNRLGTLEKGKLANFIITDGDLFLNKTKILDTWVAGKQFEVTKMPEVDVRGTWTLKIQTDSKIDTGSINISGKIDKLKSDLQINDKKIKVNLTVQENDLFQVSFSGDQIDHDGIARLTSLTEKEAMLGNGSWGNGIKFTWQAKRIKSWQEKPDTTKDDSGKKSGLTIVYPDGGYGRTVPPEQPAILIIKNATIWTSGPEGIIENCDLLVKKGIIIKIGKNIEVPLRATVIDATGKEVTPGIIDAHSHLAISGGGNEGTHAITSEVRISDVINCNDINIYRQLAGGVTASCIIHGSANPIGGQYSVIKLRWGALPDEMILHDAQSGIKFALGENVKQANWSSNPNPR